jgi:hypothetical protein
MGENEILIRDAIAEMAFLTIELARELIQMEGKTRSLSERAVFQVKFDSELKVIFDQIKLIKKMRQLETGN